MKCCGEERTTPFCPSCGAKLGTPNPLVSLLQRSRRKQQIDLRRILNGTPPFPNEDELRKFAETRPAHKATLLYRAWQDREKELAALAAVVGKDDWVRVHADALEEQGMQEAADFLRGKFCPRDPSYYGSR